MDIGGITVATSAATSANAAAADTRRQHEEEEELTPYSRVDLDGDWEFKILRSLTGAFGTSEQLRRALENQALSGWVLVEKFDNNRLRLKREVDVHDDERNPDIDPYRTQYESGHAQLAIALSLVVLATGVGASVLAYLLIN
jgi:hypothetical protein